ncbi:MAG: YcxB family protein [Sphingobacteriales bacterium]|nr:MAG: YcxB family protein [Sphingobacteriales bacterium]
MNPIEIKTRISREDYIKLLLALAYRKPIIWMFTFIGLLSFVAVILNLLDIGLRDFPFMELIISIAILIVYPTIIYLRGKRSYERTPQLKEEITYRFTTEKMRVKTENTETQTSWNKVEKVQEHKKWILIYQENLITNIIPKNAFTIEQLSALRNILPKNKLK